MPEQNADLLLLKAATKSLAHHFKKAAAHHEAMASHHEKAMAAHNEAHEHHKAMAEAPEHEEHKAHHKAKAAFHKSMAGHHEKMHKAHSAHAEHHKAMAEAHAAGDAKKIMQIAGIEEASLSTQPVTKTATTDPAPKTDPDPKTTPPEPVEFGEQISKALDTKLTEAVNAAFERVLNSEDFGKKVDQAIAGKMLEKLGQSTVNTDIKTFPVPRKQDPTPQTQSVHKAAEGLDPELADLVSVGD